MREWNICFQPLALHAFAGPWPGPLGGGVDDLPVSGGFAANLQELYQSTYPAWEAQQIEGWEDLIP